MINIFCILFGHNFVGKSQTLEGEYKRTHYNQLDWCIKCGLSKTELGLYVTEINSEIKLTLPPKE